jgi:hypothetical protein
MGAGPIQALRATALALSEATARVKGIVFTHLHLTVDGLRDVCGHLTTPVKVFMTAGQLDTWTVFTAEGKDVVEHGAAPIASASAAPRCPLDGPASA